MACCCLCPCVSCAGTPCHCYRSRVCCGCRGRRRWSGWGGGARACARCVSQPHQLSAAAARCRWGCRGRPECPGPPQAGVRGGLRRRCGLHAPSLEQGGPRVPGQRGAAEHGRPQALSRPSCCWYVVHATKWLLLVCGARGCAPLHVCATSCDFLCARAHPSSPLVRTCPLKLLPVKGASQTGNAMV